MCWPSTALCSTDISVSMSTASPLTHDHSSVQHRHVGHCVHSKPSHPLPQLNAASPFAHAYTVLCSTDMLVTVSTAALWLMHTKFCAAPTCQSLCPQQALSLTHTQFLCRTNMSVTVSTASHLSHYHSSVQHWHVSHCVHSKPFCSRIHSSVQRYVQKQNVDLNYTLSRIPSKRQCTM